MTFANMIGALAFAGLAPAFASAAVVEDISQPVATFDQLAVFDQPDLAQSFTAVSGNIAGAGLFLTGDVNATVHISVWNALPNAGGAELATASGYGTNGWLDVFWSPVSTTVSSVYYLLFYSEGDVGAVAGSPVDSYPGGMAFANTGFDPFPLFDYTFRTYTDNDDADIGVVPLPAGLPLLLTGVLAIGALQRRRRA